MYVDYGDMLERLNKEWISCAEMLEKLDPSTEKYKYVADRCSQLRDDIDKISRLKSDLETNSQTALSAIEKAKAEAEYNEMRLELERKSKIWTLVLQGAGLVTSVAQTLTILNFEQIKYGVANSKAFQWVKKNYDSFKL